MVQKIVKKIFENSIYLVGIFFAVFVFFLVQYVVDAVAPGAELKPDFSPIQDDVVVPDNRYACDWDGGKELNFGCDSGNHNGCAGFQAFCENGRVISFGSVGGHINEGPTENCGSCGSFGWNLTP